MAKSLLPILLRPHIIIRTVHSSFRMTYTIIELKVYTTTWPFDLLYDYENVIWARLINRQLTSPTALPIIEVL